METTIDPREFTEMEEIKDKLDEIIGLVKYLTGSLHPSVLKPTDFHDSRKGKDADGN